MGKKHEWTSQHWKKKAKHKKVCIVLFHLHNVQNRQQPRQALKNQNSGYPWDALLTKWRHEGSFQCTVHVLFLAHFVKIYWAEHLGFSEYVVCFYKIVSKRNGGWINETSPSADLEKLNTT